MDKSTEHSETARFLSHESVDGVDDLHDIETTYRFHNAPDRYNDSRKSTVSQSRFMLRYVLVFLAGTVFGTAILYLISTIFTRRHQEYYYNNDSNSGLLAPYGTISEIWQHNLTFSQSPTPESEAAWNSLVPVGRGFIHETNVAPFISNIAAFHQLHCLHAIMLAYYAADAAASNGSSSHHPTNKLWEPEITTRHIRHCFDYLRRSIMCAADTNLEVVDRVNRSTNGWGQEKKCRDWEGVFRYAEKWANSTDKGIIDN